MTHESLIREAVRLAQANAARGGRPFGAVVAIDGEVVATGVNDIVHSHAPTAHAELEALRAACRKLGRPHLPDAVVYASGHPCPMCLAALTMVGVRQVFYAFDNADAAPYGLSSEATYQALRLSLSPPPLALVRVPVEVSAAELYGARPPRAPA